MDLLAVFPHWNALLNATSGVFLLIGFYFIRSGQIARHRATMITTSSISALFLLSYLSHHALRTYYFGLGVALEIAVLAFIIRTAWTWPRTPRANNDVEASRPLHTARTA